MEGSASFDADPRPMCIPQDNGPLTLSLPSQQGFHLTSAYVTNWYLGNVKDKQGNKYGIMVSMAAFSMCKDPRYNNTDFLAVNAIGVSNKTSGTFTQTTDVLKDQSVLSSVVSPTFALRTPTWSIIQSDPSDWRKQKMQVDTSNIQASLSVSFTPGATFAMGNEGRCIFQNSTANHIGTSHISVSGSLSLNNGEKREVEGVMWLQVMWHDMIKLQTTGGWSWFCLHLSNGYALQVVYFYPEENEFYSYMNIISPNLTNTLLTGPEFNVTGSEPWVSPYTQATYLTRHVITIPKFNAEITIVPYVKDNEIHVFSAPVYYEGGSDASGVFMGENVTGVGYTERRR